MKVLIIETVPRSVNPIDAHVRNSIEIKKELVKRKIQCDLLFTNDKCRQFTKDYNVILVSYATPYPIYDDIEWIFKKNISAKLGWITNEYNLRPNGKFYKYFKERGAFLISNFDKDAVKFACFDNYYSINLNLFLYKSYKDTEKKYNAIYYGTYRKDRAKYFKIYLQNEIYLSSSIKNFKKFKHSGCDPKYIEKINWKFPLLRLFRYSLYLEDSFTHSNYNHLANRFYESIGCGCVVLFDKNSINTIKQSGIIDYDEFVIEKHNDLKKYNEKSYDDHVHTQNKWKENIKEQKESMIDQLIDIIEHENNKGKISLLSSQSEELNKLCCVKKHAGN